MSHAHLRLSPVDRPVASLPLARAMTVSDILREIDAPPVFQSHGVARLNGHVLDRAKWDRIRIKPDGDAVLDLVVVPEGRNTLALLASVATVALAAAVSGGLLGPAGLGLGATFAAGGLGASAAAAGVGLAGQLLVSQLTAPPSLAQDAAQRELQVAGISGNQAALLQPLPVVFGTMGLSPTLLAPAYETFTSEDITVHAVLGVQGRCRIEDVRINGLPSAEIERLSLETREGAAGDAPRTIATQTVIQRSENVTMSTFRLQLVSQAYDRLLDQDNPDNSTPDWHTFRTDGEWDECWLRVLFPSGIIEPGDLDQTVVPVRLEVRKLGETAWRKFPTIHFTDPGKGNGPVRTEVKLVRSTQPSGPHYSNSNGELPVADLTNITAISESFIYESDDYFKQPASVSGPADMLPVMTAATTSGVTMSASSEVGGSEAWRAADSSATSYWRPSATDMPHWLKIDFGSAQIVRSYRFFLSGASVSDAPTTAPTEWYWEGSADDVTWVRLDAQNVRWVSVTPYVSGQIGSPGSYRYYRLNIVRNNGAASAEVRILDLNMQATDVVGSAIGPDVATIYGALCLHLTDARPRCVYGSITKDGCTFYLDPAQWPRGVYDVRVKRGVAFQYPDIIFSSYSLGGTANADFFEYRLVSGRYVVREGQKDYRSDMVIEKFTTVDYAAPFVPDGVAMIALSVPNTTIDSVYARFTSYAPVWDGTIWTEEEFPTNNPAALYRKALIGPPNPDPVPAEIIDDAELGEWFNRCAAAGHEANAVVAGSAMAEVMQMLAACGYASPRAAARWGVVQDYDSSAEPVSQVITPINSRDLGTEIVMPRLPHGVLAEFRDADADYELAQVAVYRGGYDAATATLLETVDYRGFTDAAKVAARAAYDLAAPVLRQRRYGRELGLEHFSLQRGSRVRLVDDVLDQKVAYGVVRSVTVTGGNVVSVTLDSIMPLAQDGQGLAAAEDGELLADITQAGRPMGLAIRLADGSEIQKLVKEVSDSATCTFAVPFADTGVVTAGLLAVAGYFGEQKRRCVVVGLEATGFETRNVYLADEAPELFGGEPDVVQPAEGLLLEETQGVAVMFNYQSLAIKDTVTPANVFVGLPQAKIALTRATAASAWQGGVLDTGLANNEFALDGDPLTQIARGVRIEGQRTNLCAFSEDQSNAAWTKSNVNVTANAAVAPNGTTTADVVNETTANARHATGRAALAVTANNTYVWSVFVKQLAGASKRYPVLYMTDGFFQGAVRAAVCFDLDNLASQAGAVTGAGPVISGKGIEALPNGWYRIWIAASIGNADTSIGFFLSSELTYTNASIGASYVGEVNAGFYVWGAQIEDGVTFPSSYIPALAASATRNADVMTLATSTFNFSTTAGTVALIGRAAPGKTGNQVLWQADDGTESNRYRIARDSSGDMRFIVTTAGVDVVDMNLGAVADGARFGIAASWEANNFNAALNGAAAVQDTAGALPAGPFASMRLGRGTGTTEWFGHIEQALHYPVRRSGTVLTALSALT